MADRAYAAQHPVHRLRVPDVTMHKLEAGIGGERRDAAGVGARQQCVKHSDLVTSVHEHSDDMGPDKSGAAGHQYSHGLKLCAVTPRVSPSPPALISL